jgi:hypothetical protein
MLCSNKMSDPINATAISTFSNTTMDNQKVPGMFLLHCNGGTYGKAYVTFKVGPLRAGTHANTHTLTPWILPLAPAEGFCLDLPELVRRFRFDVLPGCESCPLEDNFQSREQPEVTRSEIRRLWWLGDDRDVLPRRGFATQQAMYRRLCYRDKRPLSLLLAAPLHPNCIAQPLQNLHIEISSNLHYEFMMHHSDDIKEFRKNCALAYQKSAF